MSIIKNKYTFKILIIFIIFFLDRISKIYILDLFDKNQVQEIVVFSFLNFYLILNEGIAFGLLNFDSQKIYNFITIIIILISLIVLFYALRLKNYSGYFFSLIFGGALGNLYDRIYFSAVPDFIDLHIGNYHWFIFNVADIFISVGIICLIFDELLFNKNKNEKN
tara:strand:- start:2214 stop:2708 length:495 start_codon:yes stop_codon:yes gene_type:complete